MLCAAGLALAIYLFDTEKHMWEHNRCSKDISARVNLVLEDRVILGAGGEDIIRRGDSMLAGYFQEGDQVLVSYCKSSERVVIYNYDKWLPNWFIATRSILLVVMGLVIISGLWRG